MFSALEIFLVMRYINLLFTYFTYLRSPQQTQNNKLHRSCLIGVSK